jgi:hypothetical protein
MSTVSKCVARRILPGLLCGLGLVTSGAVKADDVDNAVNVNPLIFTDALSHELIRVVASTPAGVTTELVITHSFECAVEGNDKTTFFNIDIVVDGVAVPPTNSDNASCTSTPPDNDAMGGDDWITTSITVVRSVPGGNHIVLVRGRLVGFDVGERVRVDDQSLVVEEEDAS